MRFPIEVLRAEQKIGETLAAVESSLLPAFPLTDPTGVIGVLSRDAIASAAADGEREKTLAELLTSREFPHLHTDHSLHAALDRMGSAGLDALPVVSRANVHHLLGIVTFDDVLALYRKPSPRRMCRGNADEE